MEEVLWKYTPYAWVKIGSVFGFQSAVLCHKNKCGLRGTEGRIEGQHKRPKGAWLLPLHLNKYCSGGSNIDPGAFISFSCLQKKKINKKK